MASLILARNGFRSSSRKSISNSTDWCRRHKNMTNVSLSRCVSHFILGNREQKTVAYLYTGILIFFAFGGEGLTNEQGYLSSLCASPFRLHNTVVSLQLRLISFQSFFKNITSFEDSIACVAGVKSLADDTLN